MTISQILVNISLISAILPIITATIYFKRLTKTLKFAAIFFIVSGLFDLLLWALVYIKFLGERNNYPLLNLFVITSILFYGIIYYREFYNQITKYTVLIMTIVTLSLVMVFSIRNSIWIYPSASITTLSILMIPISLLYFYQIFNRQEFIHIENQPLFWINSGVLIYFSFNVFLFMLLTRISEPGFYMIHSITNIIANLFFAIGLSCKPLKTT